MLAGVLFDLDQTLFDRAAAFRRLVVAELDRAGARGVKRAQAVREIDAADASGYGDRPSLLACLARHFGWTSRDTEARFREALVPHTRLRSGARELLACVAPIRTGLLTDGSEAMQTAKIDHLGIRDRFDRIQISGSFGCSKPDRRAFVAFADAWGVDPSELVMVGDHLERDVLGALDAGLQAIWINADDPRVAPLGVPRASSIGDVHRRIADALKHLPATR